MSSDQADGVKGKFTVVGGPREKSRTRFTVRVDLRARDADADVDAGLDPDDAWLAQAARRRRLVLGLLAVSLTIAFLFMWVL